MKKFILDFFVSSPPGFFLDVGAGDGVNGSNSRSLWEIGWSGMLIEPNHNDFAQLMRVYGSPNNRVILVKAALCERNGPVDFWEHDVSGWCSMDKRWIKEKGASDFRKRKVLGLTWESLGLSSLDFLSIDTEGQDASLLEIMPANFRPKLIIAEIDKYDNRTRIVKTLEPRGYRLQKEDSVNAVFALQS